MAQCSGGHGWDHAWGYLVREDLDAFVGWFPAPEGKTASDASDDHFGYNPNDVVVGRWRPRRWSPKVLYNARTGLGSSTRHKTRHAAVDEALRRDAGWQGWVEGQGKDGLALPDRMILVAKECQRRSEMGIDPKEYERQAVTLCANAVLVAMSRAFRLGMTEEEACRIFEKAYEATGGGT